MGYNHRMTEVRQTAEFSRWLRQLTDSSAVARIVARIRRMELGNPGDHRSLGAGLMEMRIDYGPGYRFYFMHQGSRLLSSYAEATNARSEKTSCARGNSRRNYETRNDEV
jgi:putative addiction module killer protein